MDKKKIALVTSSRSDYAHLRWLIHDLSRQPGVELQVLALGPHLSPLYGKTQTHISAPSLTTIECLLDSDTDVGMAKTIGIATLGMADALDRMRPDILVVIADRYEMLAPAAAALALRIPMAHIEGGEITSGAIDDAVRNALTKMSHLHFACTRRAAERIRATGEEPWRITFTGSLSLDSLHRERRFSAAQLRTRIGFRPDPRVILCVYHPVTLLEDTVAEAPELFGALDTFSNPICFIYPNADAGSRGLIERAEKFVARHPGSRVLVNLDPQTYLSLLATVGVLVGNSSSGIIESTALELPAVNVGIRQRGREHAGNVVDVPAARSAIRHAIARALTPEFRRSIRGMTSPYGEGIAARVITDKLVQAPPRRKLLFKNATQS